MTASREANVEGTESPLALSGVRPATSSFERWAMAIGLLALACFIVAMASGGNTLVAIVSLALTVASFCWLFVRSLALQRDLREARVRALDAIDLERHRIQSDLHDGAQQRLVSVRIHLGLLAQRADVSTERGVIDQLGRDLDVALGELRTVTSDSSPEVLLRNGVAESLRLVAARAPLRVSLETEGFGRYPPRIERAVYFSCVEALQNVLKHGGSRATAQIRLRGRTSRVEFSVDDSGIGFDPARVRSGSGLRSLADRISVLGGRVIIDSRPGLGTRVKGVVPLTGTAGELQELTHPFRISGRSRALRRSCHTGGGH